MGDSERERGGRRPALGGYAGRCAKEAGFRVKPGMREKDRGVTVKATEPDQLLRHPDDYQVPG
jgi:hypothetical protein